MDEQAGEMRQSNAEGGLSPPLPAAVPVSSRTNMGVYEFKHPDTDSENSRPQNAPVYINTHICIKCHPHFRKHLFLLFMIVCHIFRLLKRMLRARHGSDPTFLTVHLFVRTTVARTSGSILPTLPVEW